MNILNQLRAELDGLGNAAAQASAKRFFKEDIITRGIKTPLVHKLSAQYIKEMKDLPKKELFSLCEDLWQSGNLEESFVACNWAYSQRKKFEPADFKVFSRWIKNHVSNWASCDTFCNHTVGEFLMKYPEFLPELKKWAVSKNRWVKRAAAVSLIIPARKGLWLEEILEIATIQLQDQDDMVQKGYGWMLKSASESQLNPVFKFVMRHKAVMPRTALRYAIEKMPADKKAKAMKK
jgi:3-methyladenine DNA glycosylase AlkD